MEYAMCKNGHYYDPTVHQTCPTCAAEAAAAGGGGGAAFEPTQGVPPMSDFGATEPAGGFSQMEDYGKTEPVNMGGGFAHEDKDPDATRPVSSGFTEGGFTDAMRGSFPGGRMEEMDVTQAMPVNGVHGFAPVVGWLVAIEGPARGTDYKICPGYNFIGRDEHMDICIKGDLKISRNKAAVIGYEPEERLFLFGPSEGKSFVKVNGKAVLGQTEIQDRDIIRIGSTKLLFIPLCDERFNWDE